MDARATLPRPRNGWSDLNVGGVPCGVVEGRLRPEGLTLDVGWSLPWQIRIATEAEVKAAFDAFNCTFA